MSAVVAIVGEGELADYTGAHLAGEYEVVRRCDLESGTPIAANLVLVLHDAWHPSVHLKAEELLRQAGIPWLRGFVSFGEGVIGPLVRPGTTGCSQCADGRRFMAGRERKEVRQLQQSLATRGGVAQDAWASRMGLLQMAHLLLTDTRDILTGMPARTEEHLFLINLSTLESERHFVLPDSLCPVCGDSPSDSEAVARIALRSSPKVSADGYRTRSAEDLSKVLAPDYLDYRTGLFNGRMADLLSPFADASVNLPLLGEDVGTAGRTHSYAASELTAILEGLERYSSLEPRSKRTVVHGSYRELEAQALDPLRLGVHAEEQYARPGFPFRRFDPELPIHWVWGYSFLEERPILVPQQTAYYGAGGERRFLFESSNGCALGGSLEEAIFYGILEVVERDSFLMAWYARLPLPRLDLSTSGDRELQLMTERLRTAAGFDVYFYNATTENGIPSVWGIAKNKTGAGVNLICAAGAHPDPLRAVKGAVHELSGMVSNLDKRFETDLDKIVRMYHDSSLVQRMEDHSLLYGLPQAQERLAFLLDESRPIRAFDEAFERKGSHSDLTDDLKEMLQTFRKLNLDVIAVDLTAPELARNGLHCVKVLITGMLPMTFGHHFTRLTGLERVLNVPAKLGYAKRPLTPEQLNPYPHPFP